MSYDKARNSRDDKDIKERRNAQKTKKNTRGSSNKGSKNYNSRTGKNERQPKSIAEDLTKSSTNDPTWHIPVGADVTSVTNYSFGSIIGSQVSGIYRNELDHGKRYVVPGMMKVLYEPVVGIAKHDHDPLNRAAQMLYQQINSRNSRNASYDKTDLMLYIIGVANAWSLYSYFLRAFKLVRAFNVTNSYIPRDLVESMGLGSDFYTNFTHFESALTAINLGLSNMIVPPGIDYFKRAIWMNSFVYTDENSPYASMWYYAPASYYIYQEESAGPSKLHRMSFPNRFEDIEAMVDFMNSVMDPLLNSQDIMSVMGPDILKAYGGNLYVPELPKVDESPIVYNELVNYSLHNAVFVSNLDNGDITQDPTKVVLKHDIRVTSNAAKIGGETAPINLPTPHPDSGTLIEVTRHIPAWYGAVGTESSVALVTSGPEILTECIIYSHSRQHNSHALLGKDWYPTRIYPFTLDNHLESFRILELTTCFKHPPKFRVVNSQDYEEEFIIFDAENVGTMSVVDLTELNELLTYGLFEPKVKVN